MLLQSASLLAVLSAGFLLSATTTVTAGPGAEYWSRHGVPASTAKSPAVVPVDPVVTKDCSSCKIVDVKRVVPSANGRYQENVVEKKVVCTEVKDAVASSCCAATKDSAPVKTHTHGT
jgi:hypothetical protein